MLDRLTIERVMAWTGDKPVLVALSGGGDSVALLNLLAAELGASGLRAVIVDHALREGSDADAKRAHGFAAELGVSAEILTLTWEGGANHAQQAAREARYRAICDYARAHGLNTITAAHTADDQAETVLMRAANGSTWRGLAGIAPFAFAPLWPEGRGIALARPLLGARREELRAYLRDQRAPWIEDPANANPKFERVRVRKRLAALEAGGFDPLRLVAIAQRLRASLVETNTFAAALIAKAARFGQGRVLIDRATWIGPSEVRTTALSALIAAASGAQRQADYSALARLDAQMQTSGFGGGSLGGAVVRPAKSGFAVERDPGAIEGRAGLAAAPTLALSRDIETVWDGRVAVRALLDGVELRPGVAAPEFHSAGEPAPEGAVLTKWLLAERTAHALGVDVLL